jgi:hypothetical protein
LFATTTDAVATLRRALTADDAPWPVRVNAAVQILELATDHRHRRDLVDRLARVEEEVARTPGRWRA